SMTQSLILRVIEGKQPGFMIPVPDGGGSIGSAQTAMMVLNEPGVERFHAVICVDGNGLCIRADCAQGIKVNGQQTQKSPLKPGDIIELGRCKFAVTTPSTPEEAFRNVSPKP